MEPVEKSPHRSGPTNDLAGPARGTRPAVACARVIGVVTNPNALGAVRDRKLALRLADIVGRDGVVHETKTPEELRQAIGGLRAAGCDIVATCGGDGTNLSAVTEMVRVWGADGRPLPRWCILRGGTLNTVATNLGIEGHPEQILGRLVTLVRQRAGIPSRTQDLLGVNDMHGFLFAGAMGGRFLEAYYGGPTTGPAWGAVLAGRTIASAVTGGPFARWLFDPLAARVVVDGVPLAQDRFTLLVAATIRDVGIGFRPTYRAGEAPGRFHLVASSLSALRLASQATRVRGGRPLRGTPHTDVVAERVEIDFAQPQTWTLDGDLFRTTRLVLTGGQRVHVLTP